MSKNIKKTILDYSLVFIGCVLLAFAITSILKPNGLISGGVTGISILLEQLIKVKYTYIYYTLTILVLSAAWVLIGKKEALKIIVLSLLFPFILIVMENLNYDFIENDLFLASIYFGLIAGIGVGLIMKQGFSMGGTDTISKILHRKFLPFMSLSQLILLIDGTVIFASIFVFDVKIALYAIITQLVFVKAIDLIMFGMGSKKVKIEIISRENEKVETFIIHEINRGISAYEIIGGYTNQRRRKIVSICSPRESMLIRSYISKIDPEAFINVLPVISVWGKGVGFDSLLDEQD